MAKIMICILMGADGKLGGEGEAADIRNDAEKKGD